MCIIAVTPAGLHLKDDVLRTCWNNNSDGAGFMYAEKGKLIVNKGFMNFDSFADALRPHQDKGCVLHFRIRTHGETNEVNTHPFVVDDKLAFAHNGTISGYGCTTYSDTWHFNEQVVKDLRRAVPSFLHVKAITTLMREKIGFSKLVFMDNTGEVTILNEDKGEYSSDGIWFSNSSWKPRQVVTYSYPPTRHQTHTCFTSGVQLQADDYIYCLSENQFARKYGITNTVYEKLEKGELFKITAYNQDTSWDIKSLVTKDTYRISNLASFEKCNLDGILLKPWGHFTVGKRLIVVDVENSHCSCIDPLNDKTYNIPSRLLKINYGH